VSDDEHLMAVVGLERNRLLLVDRAFDVRQDVATVAGVIGRVLRVLLAGVSTDVVVGDLSALVRRHAVIVPERDVLAQPVPDASLVASAAEIPKCLPPNHSRQLYQHPQARLSGVLELN
jgi:hypothetical protein